MTWRRLILPIALAAMLVGCVIPQPVAAPEQSIRLITGRQYIFVYNCQALGGCVSEVVTIADPPHDGWVLLADGRAVNVRLVLAILPYEPPAEAEPPAESPSALRV